jgi:hypothetical protein
MPARQALRTTTLPPPAWRSRPGAIAHAAGPQRPVVRRRGRARATAPHALLSPPLAACSKRSLLAALRPARSRRPLACRRAAHAHEARARTLDDCDAAGAGPLAKGHARCRAVRADPARPVASCSRRAEARPPDPHACGPPACRAPACPDARAGPHLVREQEADCLQALLASVNVVPQEQVVRLRREAPVLEQPQEVGVLPVDIAWCRAARRERQARPGAASLLQPSRRSSKRTADFNGCLQLQQVGLGHEDFLRGEA